jgi:hypothetical protein
MQPFKTLRALVLGVAVLSCMFALSSPARADVITFEDLSGDGQLADGYHGITWNSQWAYYSDPQSPYNPHSGSERVYNLEPNGTRPRDASFSFGAPVVFDGAWFAGFSFTSVSFQLYLGGNLVATSGSINPTDTPAFLASGYNGLVDTVTVDDNDPNQVYDFYVMDDVTFHGGVATPEPASLTLLGLGALGMVGYRLRRRQAKA